MNVTKFTDYEPMEIALKFQNAILIVFIFTMIIPVEAQTSKNSVCEDLWNPYSSNSFSMKRDTVLADSIPSIKVYRNLNYKNSSYSPEAQKYLSYANKVNIKNIAIPNWEKLNQDEKEAYVYNLKQRFIDKADSIQREETKNLNPFTLENNTSDIILIQLQDFSIINVLEAKNKSGEWQPVEYWDLSSCERSFHRSIVNPYTKVNFTRNIINHGNYSTKGRLATYVNQSIVYSDEFDLTIDECKLNIPEKVISTSYYWLGNVEKLNKYLNGFRNGVIMQ